MSITIVPICHDCNEELSNWDRFKKKYPKNLVIILCSCEKKREKNQKELAQSIADDLIYDDLTRGGKLKEVYQNDNFPIFVYLLYPFFCEIK